VFANSMSDWAHEDIPDEFVHRMFDAMESTPDVIYQLLTKRPVRARKFLVGRYGNRGIPAHLWIGTTAESNDVAARVNVLRSIQDRCGHMTAFLSVEPIIGPTDGIDFAGMSWIITGGESGPGARIMQRDWLMASIVQAKRLRIALWHKQSGQPRSHPNWNSVPAGMGVLAGFQWLQANGLETLPYEKGGATVDGITYRELPPHFYRLEASMNAGLI
jgi:protein gp37